MLILNCYSLSMLCVVVLSFCFFAFYFFYPFYVFIYYCLLIFCLSFPLLFIKSEWIALIWKAPCKTATVQHFSKSHNNHLHKIVQILPHNNQNNSSDFILQWYKWYHPHQDQLIKHSLDRWNTEVSSASLNSFVLFNL